MRPPPDLAAASDQEIVALALEGTHAAYNEIVRRYRPRVQKIILGIVRNEARADDLMQETFLKVFNALHRYDPARPFTPWIRSIARNTAYGYLNARFPDSPNSLLTVTPGWIEENPLDMLTPSGPLMPLPFASAADAALDEALKRLRPEYRRCIILRFRKGRSYREIAEIMRIPQGTVATYIRRAKAELKETAPALLDACLSDSPPPA